MEMNLTIGANIKRLRTAKNITQEQLSAAMNVTCAAVSKWERGETYPDITLLQPLAYFFGVTLDELMGYDREKVQAEIEAYLSRGDELLHEGKHTARTALLREANRKFPREYNIMECLADSLVGEYSRKGIREYDEVFSLCNRILAECTDSLTRYKAIRTLGTAYGYAGKQEELAKLADEMPRTHFSYENFMMYRWNGDADFEEFQGYLSFLIYQTAEMMELATVQKHDDGTYIYPLKDRIRLRKTEVSFLELLFPDGDYQFKAQLGEIACSFLCSAYMRQQDYEETWKWLEKGVDFAIHMDTYDFDAVHTSPILRGYSDGGWIMEAEGNRSQSILEWLLHDEEVAVLRSDPRYEMLTNRLQKVAKKP
jgi:transcriptional regulator with XRE-family HTH domain